MFAKKEKLLKLCLNWERQAKKRFQAVGLEEEAWQNRSHQECALLCLVAATKLRAITDTFKSGFPFVLVTEELINLCFYWVLQARRRFKIAEATPVKWEQCSADHSATVCANFFLDLSSNIKPKFLFEFLFKVFLKNLKSPSTGRI